MLIREYGQVARSIGVSSGVLKGTLVTDEQGLPIKTVDTVYDSSVECAALTARTHFVVMEAVDSTVRYKVRPKRFSATPVTATDDDAPIPAGASVTESVYPGAIIAFRQTTPVGDVNGIAFQSSYVPVLAL